MFKSTFSKYMAAFILIILVSFLMLSGIITSMIKTYAMEDKENNLIVLKYQVLGKINLGKVSAIYANNGTSLSILFDANELFTMLKKIASAASSLSSTATLAGLSTIVEQYDGMLLGYKMSRVK